MLTLRDMIGALSPEVRLTDWIRAPFEALSPEEATTIECTSGSSSSACLARFTKADTGDDARLVDILGWAGLVECGVGGWEGGLSLAAGG